MYRKKVTAVAADAHLPSELSSMPVTAFMADYPAGYVVAPHAHACAQLLYAIQGVMIIEARQHRWVVPPSHGVWLQAGLEHAVRMSGDVKMRTVFVREASFDKLPPQNCVIRVSPLLRELILAATDIPLEYTLESRDGKLMSLLVDELKELSILPMHLPWPQDERLREVCDWISRHPADDRTLKQWAGQLHIAEKTLHRLFLRETATTFGRWRQQMRLLLALEKIAQGEKILTVALEHGYESQSAFNAMFKKHLGFTPRQWLK
ncbi:helix-turn-helix transcriptional regulator [Methylobacillus caricis]|uniref:AraC family transcriptional regulator n=1 Tax=Methylobacillus caricis TaxID=1971611 RepID=UPI001CFF6FEF|nr:helix-turn-helix transcriptional regulator [Methylobacillus caricis]MCB5186854.1 helix-turn-helix transcriptional regulator [Methylobacillus caricis]